MQPTRRTVLAAGIAGAASALVRPAPAASPAPRRLRIAHLTDIHLQPELQAAKGLEACLAHVQSLPERGEPAADLIVTGGDTVMDCMEADAARTKLQWDLWDSVKAASCSLGVHSVIGNHDVWGWGRTKARTTGDEPLYGKQLACERFGRPLPYESFDRGGWHIVLLDSSFPHAESYVARLDDAQWEWFEKDLAAVPATTPIVVFTHIPILSLYPLANTDPTPTGEGRPALPVSGQLIHTDHRRFQQLFARHRNVKACVSGHLHIVESVTHDGVHYLCHGAVSGAWWKGLHRGTDFGYAVCDLFDDGTVRSHYVPYGWTART
jgi:3',5'-cyclic AMP phosphodiesterase CpdA